MSAKTVKKENAARLRTFFDSLAAKGLGGAVLDRRDDYFYLSGYTGSDAVLVLSVKAGKGWLITDSRYTEEAEKTAPGIEVLEWRDGFAAFTGRLLKKLRLKKVGYTPNSMTAAFFAGMKAEAGGVTEWRDVGSMLSLQRAVKSASEIAAMRAALACAEAAFKKSRRRWKVGMTEIEVKNDLEWEMKRLGAESTSFETIVAVGANASLPHAHAGNRKIQAGKMLLIDFGAQLNRYCSDLTRTLWPGGDIPAVWRKRYQAVLEAQQAGIDRIKAGVPTTNPYAGAVEVFKKYGLAEKFTHSLGHGIGLVVHEVPRLSAIDTNILTEGFIVTVEPGVYFPGSGGIRVEEMVLVGKDGATILSSLPKRLEDAVF